jgi:hypothetical protein
VAGFTGTVLHMCKNAEKMETYSKTKTENASKLERVAEEPEMRGVHATTNKVVLDTPMETGVK